MDREQREIVNNYNKMEKDYRKSKKRTILKVVSILFFALLVVRFVHGKIEIKNPIDFSADETRAYRITINGIDVVFENRKKKSIPIIPFFVDLVSKGQDINFPVRDKSSIPLSDKYEISVKSYKCFSAKNDYPIACNYRNDFINFVEMDDFSIKKMIITKDSKILYDGVYANDISMYLIEKGEYAIELDLRYKRVSTDITFNFHIE